MFINNFDKKVIIVKKIKMLQNITKLCIWSYKDFDRCGTRKILAVCAMDFVFKIFLSLNGIKNNK